MRVELANGKYTVIQEQSGQLHCLRYGDPWRDCTGDGLIFTLAAEVEALRERIDRAVECAFRAADEDPIKIINETIGVLLNENN